MAIMRRAETEKFRCESVAKKKKKWGKNLVDLCSSLLLSLFSVFRSDRRGSQSGSIWASGETKRTGGGIS